MKTLLRIDASIRHAGSYTRILTDYYEQVWLSANPDGDVIRRCLATDPVPHLSQVTLEAFDGLDSRSGARALSDVLIGEFKTADHIVIGSPLYNFTLSSSLKAYFDHVVRSGVTFELRNGGYRGLMEGKCATVVTAQGGQRTTDGADDFQTAYLRRILEFVGISDLEVITLEGTSLDENCATSALGRAKRDIDKLFDKAVPGVWCGDFSDEDRRALTRLREGQADAIISGDADAYAALCAETVQLLIPGRDLVCGLAAFREAEQALFATARFKAFHKYPVSVERSGDLAVEVGRQEIVMENMAGGGVFAGHQKYTHVFRRTGAGWRFALLMSNPSE
jgi:FMN-dependent NADH-azoreductase